jgi:HAD superfamily hydrolase (TIGR01450 family)
VTVLPGDYDAVVLDLDGVVYRGAAAVSGSVEAVSQLAAAGIPVVFATNNAARPPTAVAAHLAGLGISVVEDRVVTSAQVAVGRLQKLVSARAEVLVIGGEGLHEAVRRAGLGAVASAADAPEGVVQGFGRDVGWRLLAEASYAVAAGAVWVATNTDLTVPTDRGIAPGTGSMVAAVSAATGKDPVVTGKPAPELHLEAAARVGARNPLVVGDRLDTDIAGAAAAGMDSGLVLTGVSSLRDLAERRGPQPTWVADSLLDLVSGRVRSPELRAADRA